jgi:hypothetical protein
MRNHIEPYMILTGRVLRGLSSIRPKSPAKAEDIPGIIIEPRILLVELH